MTDGAIEVSIMGLLLLGRRCVVIVITGRTGVVIVISIGHHAIGCGKAWKRHGTLG